MQFDAPSSAGSIRMVAGLFIVAASVFFVVRRLAASELPATPALAVSVAVPAPGDSVARRVGPKGTGKPQPWVRWSYIP